MKRLIGPACLIAGIFVAGLEAKGYIPPPVALMLYGLLGGGAVAAPSALAAGK